MLRQLPLSLGETGVAQRAVQGGCCAVVSPAANGFL